MPAIWTMNGTTPASDANLSDVGPTWHVAEAADFNADRKADILWQNDDGLTANWTMNSTKPISYSGLAGCWERLALGGRGRYRVGEVWAGIASHKGEAGVSYLKSAFVSSIGLPCGVRSAAWSQASR